MRIFTFATVAAVLSMFAFDALAGADIPVLLKRCEEDSLTPAQARARVGWFLDNYFGDARVIAENATFETLTDAQVVTYWEQTCLISPTTGAQRLRPMYPTFALADLTNPVPYFAPPPTTTHPTVSDAIPEGYQVVGMCIASCYKPDGLVRFAVDENGTSDFKDVEIAQAQTQLLRNVAVLSDESSLEAPVIISQPVYSYAMSSTPTEHQIYVFTTESGHVLEVTGNHPIVDSTGLMREATEFVVGDALVRDDGNLDAIKKIEIQSYYGRVYNVAPKTESLLGNVVIANGFLAGSSWYMNDGVSYINEKIFRGLIPEDVL